MKRNNQEESIFYMLQGLYKHSKATNNLHRVIQVMALRLGHRVTLYFAENEENKKKEGIPL